MEGSRLAGAGTGEIVGRVVRLLDANKAIAAFFAPLVTGLLAVVAHALVSGEWNLTETKGLLGAFIMSVASAFGTWATPVKSAIVHPGPPLEKVDPARR